MADTEFAPDTTSFSAQLKSGLESISAIDRDIDTALKQKREVISKGMERIGEVRKRAAEVKFPDLQEPPPAPALHETDPVQAFGSSAMWLAVFGGLLTKRSLTNSLNAAGGVFEAIHKRDLEGFDREFKKWQIESQNAVRLQQYQMDRYRAIMEATHKDEQSILAEIGVEASAVGDQVVAMHAEQRNMFEVLRILVAREKHVEQMRRTDVQFADKAARYKAFTQLSEARANLQMARKLGDQEKITQYQGEVQAAEQAMRDVNEAFSLSGRGVSGARSADAIALNAMLEEDAASANPKGKAAVVRDFLASKGAGKATSADSIALNKFITDNPEATADDVVNFMQGLRTRTSEIGETKAGTEIKKAEIGAGAHVKAAQVTAESRNQFQTAWDFWSKLHPNEAATPEGREQFDKWYRDQKGVLTADDRTLIEAMKQDAAMERTKATEAGKTERTGMTEEGKNRRLDATNATKVEIEQMRQEGATSRATDSNEVKERIAEGNRESANYRAGLTRSAEREALSIAIEENARSANPLPVTEIIKQHRDRWRTPSTRARTLAGQRAEAVDKAVAEKEAALKRPLTSDELTKEINKQTQVMTGNRLDQLKSNVNMYSYSLDKIDSVLDLMKKHSMLPGGAGYVRRGAEAVGNVIGYTGVDAAKFEKEVKYIQAIALQLLTAQTARPLAASQQKLFDFVGGLNLRSTTKNTVDAMRGLRDLYIQMRRDTAERGGIEIDGESKEAASPTPGSPAPAGGADWYKQYPEAR